ncbi:uncharacterized protein LOC122047890 [Zingiber officinale]|uniref:SAM domain-containing protein n=1 Tax=Zingiber officinale TaxID=94328 RepID=A0A8J5HGR6_ZINOF|nr:uncharacterized protein LOC122047890 [Zingiber officinale]KAG6526705.1 hypothetical protein ZIOFF_016706 [Zingiber officinale]
MDWYSWLSDADLDPDLVYHLSLLFSGNQLGEDDIAHFDHEFLKSMGISIAKHRLEILKLAKKRKYSGLRRFTRFLAAAGSSIAKYLSYSLLRRNSSAIVVVAAPAPAKGDMLKRRRKMVVADGGGGGGARVAPPTAAVAVKHAGEIRWDSMFQDLKPN